MFNETKILELPNSAILVLLNKYKTFELRNSEILLSLKIQSLEKLAIKSQFDLTQFFNSVF